MLNITIEEIKLASKIVKNKNLPRCVKKLSNESDYNCWGFTAWSLKLVKRLYWISNSRMEEILDELTEPTDNPKPGDIVVYRTDFFGEKNYLMHTAIVTDPKRELMIHKDGGDPLEFSMIDNTVYTGNPKYDNPTVKFRKVKK